jgi:type II secretory ATPase GspE/PulE/Tfp pilus assembly ATPase PilB-like protein
MQVKKDPIKLVDALIQNAISHRASDIHLEPTECNLRVRFRIDGILYDQESIDVGIAQQVCARIEVLSNIDGAKRRVPHDGKFCVVHNNRPIDLRVSSFPSLYGPKMVVRILDRLHHQIALDQLGMDDIAEYERFVQLIQKSSGFLLVSGPTGSGKTTTLYAALAQLNKPEKHIITLEDPVEYQVNGITQGHIYLPAGFTFEKGMRALLRQDPDIVMVGEIRDRETAQIALEAALTGHMVFSTVHTNDAASVVMRLIDMDIEPFLINAALTGVLAQRLARKVCAECRDMHEPTETELRILKKYHLEPTLLAKGAGCQTCNNTGYKGRTGIFELLEISHDLRTRISNEPVFDDIYQQGCADGMRPLIRHAEQKLKEGIISLAELVRIIA